MSLFREHPNLFLTGNFKIYRDGEVYHIKKYWIGSNEIEALQYQYEEYELFAISDKRTKLIARPISDMTDEEEEIYNRHKMYGDMVMTSDGLLYLLSIGVYPGPQDDEDVIFQPKHNESIDE